MKLQILISFFWLLASAIAIAIPTYPSTSGLESASAPPIEDAIRGAGRAFEALDNYMQNIRRDLNRDAGQKIETAINLQRKVVDELRRGGRDVRRGNTINGQEQIKLRDWMQALTALYKRTTEEWISLKQTVVATGHRNNVLTTLLDLSEATLNFAEAAQSKIVSLIGPQAVTPTKNIQIAYVENAILSYRRG
jgi:hypothetical protein